MRTLSNSFYRSFINLAPKPKITPRKLQTNIFDEYDHKILKILIASIQQYTKRMIVGFLKDLQDGSTDANQLNNKDINRKEGKNHADHF